MPPKRTNRKRATRRPLKKRGFKKAKDVGEFASCSETRTLKSTAGGINFDSGVLYSQMNTQLAGFTRASAIAVNYQHYRIKKITMTFKPAFDSYIATGGGASKPSLYYMIDKSGSIPTNITLEGLKQMGAKAHNFDEKPVPVSWRPSVLEAVAYQQQLIGGTVASKYRISPWLSTSEGPGQVAPLVPSGVDHLGMYFYVDQLANPQGAQYTVDIEVQFQFKKPLIDTAVGQVSAIPAVLAIRNASRDGVVGGADDNDLTH